VPLAALAFIAALLPVAVKQIESWRALLSILIVVVFVIPIKRYEFPVNLPFDLEPYRVVVLLLAAIWVAALLIDPNVRLRRSQFDLPLVALFIALMASDSLNIDRIHELGVEVDVAKSLSFFASFLVVYFLAYTVLRTREDIEYLIRVIVLGAAFVAVFALIEYRMNSNIFNRLSEVLPILEFRGDPAEGIARSGRLRVYASAQHPIALSGALMMVLPLALYLAQTTRKAFWWLSSFAVGLGALATLSRTGPIMALAAAVTLLVLRPRDTKRLVPLAVPALIVTFFVLPNALGTFKSAFFPQGGIVAEQSGVNPGNELQADNRLADIGPTLEEWKQRPAFGQGFGTRIVDGDRRNARILDDQWLAFLLEAGAVGVAILLWLFIRSVRLLGRIARRDASSLGLLSASIAASIASCGVGMFTYDTYSFVQVTFLLFLFFALAASVLAISSTAEEPVPEVVERRAAMAAVGPT
jgi:O-Antigen ligase